MLILILTAAVHFFDIRVDTIGGRFSAVVATFPAPHATQVSWQMIVSMVSPTITIALLGGITVTGAIARIATIVKNVGRAPVARVVHAVTLLLIMLAFGRWGALIPMPTLAAILLVVACNMSEWH